MKFGKVRRICAVVASRANYARIKSFLKTALQNGSFDLHLVVCASALLERTGNIVGTIERDGIPIDETRYFVIDGSLPVNMAKSTGLGIMEMSDIFNRLKPDMVLTVADRYETMATAIAASYMNIPLVHTQGGEITGSIDESVRHAITQLAHIHFPATEQSRERIIKLGQDPRFVWNTGCPSLDIIPKDLSLPDDFFHKCGGVGELNKDMPYVVIAYHPVTSEWSEARTQMENILEAVSRIDAQVFLLWPNIDAGSDGISKAIRLWREKHDLKHWQLVKNIEPEEYARLMYNARCLIGNTSSGIREGSYLGVPYVLVGNRQKGRERGANTIEVGYCLDDIENVIKWQIRHGKYEPDHLFGDGRAGERMAQILSSISDIEVQKSLQI